jgi:uncharacterized protein
MSLIEPNYIEQISATLELKKYQTEAVLSLTAEGSTVPFIARYRKEATGNLDEKEIRDILELQGKIEALYKAKVTAINGITEQGKLTPELESSIINCETLKAVEEIYKPYRLKRKTKAMIALEKGFGVVAEYLKQNNTIHIPEELSQKYSEEEITDGVVEIIAAEIVIDTDHRHFITSRVGTTGIATAKKKSEKMLEKLDATAQKQVYKFDTYAEFTRKISLLKPYQTLALNRGENLGILSVSLDVDDEVFEEFVREIIRTKPHEVYFRGITLGYKNLYESVENEIRGSLTELAELDAVSTFAKNLRNLLMTKPEYGKRILAIDPGFRTGCKLAILDTLGNPIYFDKIYLDSTREASEKLQKIVERNPVDVIVVGNGTGSSETIELLTICLASIPTYVVSEAGASVYSASDVASQEFPSLDVTDRGTISIGRRYIDPLSELVKIPPQSIGVGMYQHDVSEKTLAEKLGYVIEDVVNAVWVNVNSASAFVLTYISGLNKKSAQKLSENRPYHSRKSIKKVLGEKSYEQAIGFLRVPNSPEPLDNTDIHPDQYELAYTLIEEKITSREYPQHESSLKKIYPDVNPGTLDFIWQSYESLGRDPRTESTAMVSTKKLTLETVWVGDILDWVVRNVVAFGAFVDVGLKNDGLVHISEIVDRYIRDPNEVLEVGQKVRVKITKIEKETGKIQLSIRQAK